MLDIKLAAAFVISAIAIGQPAVAQITLRPAPGGAPTAVAARVIAKAKQPCARVVSARRMPDGGIAAICSNRELYLVASIDRVGPVALRCSEAKRLLGISCLE
jgi:hypothetical protein